MCWLTRSGSSTRSLSTSGGDRHDIQSTKAASETSVTVPYAAVAPLGWSCLGRHHSQSRSLPGLGFGSPGHHSTTTRVGIMASSRWCGAACLGSQAVVAPHGAAVALLALLGLAGCCGASRCCSGTSFCGRHMALQCCGGPSRPRWARRLLWCLTVLRWLFSPSLGSQAAVMHHGAAVAPPSVAVMVLFSAVVALLSPLGLASCCGASRGCSGSSRPVWARKLLWCITVLQWHLPR